MRWVLDSSVAFKSLVPEQDSRKAVDLVDEFRMFHHDLIAPNVFSYELAHALTRAERQGRLAQGEASFNWTSFMAFPPILFEDSSLIERGIEISSQYRIGVYDCVYVALAEREGCELLTADAKLVSNLHKHFPFIVELSTLP